MTKRALITGITGQDGSYLAELLLKKGYEVHGTVRRRAGIPPTINKDVNLLVADVLDQPSLMKALFIAQPREVYNLAALSFVPDSWQQPILTMETNALGVMRLLDAVRQVTPWSKVFQASSSEMFGRVTETPQNELTRFYPRSPYGVAKAAGHHLAVNFRESYDAHVSCGIMFNHESPKRGLEFVTRKVCRAAARKEKVVLGNIDARRDWGYAGDYVQAMWLMLQQREPDDYVIATGEQHTVRELVELAGVEYETDSSLFRPAEVDSLIGGASKAKEKLGWTPRVGFKELIDMMVQAERESRRLYG